MGRYVVADRWVVKEGTPPGTSGPKDVLRCFRERSELVERPCPPAVLLSWLGQPAKENVRRVDALKG